MYDVVIIGGGVVGASCAFYLSQYDLKIAILEKENDVSLGTSKANSAIIHAGYDPAPNTLMAKFNVEGNFLTKEIAKKLNVRCLEVGSLVLAFNEEEEKTVHELYAQGIENKVPDLKILNKEEVLQKEENINKDVICALYAPSAAIIEPWDLTLALMQTAVTNGSELFLNTEVVDIIKNDGHYTLKTKTEDFNTKYVFNCAGVFSDTIHNMVSDKRFTIKPYIGEYYLLDKSQGNLVNHIIFKAPSGITKGVLVAPTIHGNLIVGPNNNIIEGITTKTTKEGLSEVRNLSALSVPNIDFSQNIRNFSGIRAISDVDDFIIEEVKDAKGFFDIGGIKSPGLSAAVAIGKHTISMLENINVSLNKKDEFILVRDKTNFKDLSIEDKNALIKENSKFARVICRCETITEGEILQMLNMPIPPTTVEGVKRRTGAGLGRCQGGFCAPKVLEILAKHYNKDLTQINYETLNSNILVSRLKEEI